MALINCPECNKEVSDSAKMCPHCGYELFDYKLRNAKKPPQYTHQPKKKNGCLIAIGAIVFISILSAIFGDDDSSDKDAIVTKIDNVDAGKSVTKSEIKTLPKLTDKQKAIKLDSLIVVYKQLYNELQTFKSSSNFKTYGFGKGGRYHTWLQRAETVSKDDQGVDILLANGLFIGDLLRLGLAYAGSEGTETDITKDINKTIIAGLKRRSTNFSSKAKSASNKARIGKWKITNLYTKEINHTIEIYKESDKYFALIDYGNEQKKETLSKKGRKYFIVGNRYGEWYLLKDDVLIMGDKEGEIEDGTIATSY